MKGAAAQGMGAGGVGVSVRSTATATATWTDGETIYRVLHRAQGHEVFDRALRGEE